MVIMAEKQKVKVPVYVAEFLEDEKYCGYGLIKVMNELVETHATFYRGSAYDKEDYVKIQVASWVENVKGDGGTYDGLFVVMSDIHQNGYEVEYVEKEFIVYDKVAEEFVNEDFEFSDFEEAIRFKTKEEAKKFIINNYEIQEIYDYEEQQAKKKKKK